MKPFVLFLSVFISSYFSTCNGDKNISGTWLMVQGNSSPQIPVLRIKMEEGVWQGKLDLPQQEIYDRQVYSIIAKGDSIFITTYKNGPVIRAAINDSFITGVITEAGRVDTVKFKRA